MTLVHKMMLRAILLAYIISSSFTSASVIKSLDDLESLPLSDKTCETPECIKRAGEIRENMDETVNPCDDFYKFSCGGYLAKRTIPEDKPYIGVYFDVREVLKSQLKELVTKALDGSEPKFIKMVKDMYDTCMNVDSIEASNSVPLKKALDSLGGWPVVQGESWDASKFDWMETTFNIRKLGFGHNMLMNMDVDEDFRNKTIYVIKIDENFLGIPSRTYYLNGLSDSTTAAYFNLMVKAANKLGANEASSEKELMDVLTFETTLANYKLPIEERRNYGKFYNKYTIQGLKELVPEIDWLKYFNGLLKDPVSDSETIIVGVPDFLKKLADLLAKTDKRIVANYMMWRVVLESFPMLSKDWRDLHQEYIKELRGSSSEEPRWEQCMKTLSRNLALAQSAYYIKNYFQAESRTKADEIVKYLRKEFLTILDNIDWMDDVTKTRAIEKANAVVPYVGYPLELADDSLVMEYYQNLIITTDSYFDNVMNLKKFETDDAFSNLRKPNVKGDWKKHTTAAIVNAYFNSLENSIELPAGILQKEFFHKDRPYYLNFGGIGHIIGHEITHGFDDIGCQFDIDGINQNWWDDTTNARFKEKAQCIIDQYSNYTAENGLKINGINTQGENIADVGGMKEAYLAYRAWVKANGPEPKLPGLKYTPSQLLWISTANIWCAKYKPKSLKLQILTGWHSPPQFRVIGSMSNLAEFAREFQCPPGSPMNPHEKCKIW